MPGRVFVTGASGFVGTAVVNELLSRGYGVNALVRSGSLKAAGEQVRVVSGDLFNSAALDEGVRGCDAVVHLVGIISENPSKGVTFRRIHVEGTRQVADAAGRNGVTRFIHMSALGTRPNAASEYHRTKYEAEEIVRAGTNWTIFRPSMIHGPGGEFTGMLAKWARRQAAPFLFMPYFGAGPLGLGGAGMLQPVHVNDVARAFVDAIANPQAVGQSYELGGGERLTWPELHRAAAEAIVGKRRPVVPLPAWYARALTYIVPRALLPFNRDQVLMSQEDNTADLSKFVGDFGWEPKPFREAFRSYAGTL